MHHNRAGATLHVLLSRCLGDRMTQRTQKGPCPNLKRAKKQRTQAAKPRLRPAAEARPKIHSAVAKTAYPEIVCTRAQDRQMVPNGTCFGLSHMQRNCAKYMDAATVSNNQPRKLCHNKAMIHPLRACARMAAEMGASDARQQPLHSAHAAICMLIPQQLQPASLSHTAQRCR